MIAEALGILMFEARQKIVGGLPMSMKVKIETTLTSEERGKNPQ